MSVITVIAIGCLVLFPIACLVAFLWFRRLMAEGTKRDGE